ncbi:MAG: outer membrane beta-barrel protein [Rikenellaceae bacterium]
MNRHIYDKGDWSTTLRDRVREVSTPPSKDLWRDIEQEIRELSYDVELDSSKSTHLWRLSIGGVAAVAAILLVMLFVDAPSTVEDILPMIVETQDRVVEVVDKPVIPDSRAVENVSLTSGQNIALVKPQYTPPVESVPDMNDNSVEPPKRGEDVSKANDDDTSEEYKAINNYPQSEDIKQSYKKTTMISLSGSGAILADNSAIRHIQPTAYEALLFPSGGRDNIDNMYERCNVSHHQPFSVGVRVQHYLSPYFSVVSGVNYTRLISDLTYGSDFDKQQKIHFVGIPFNLYYHFLSANKFTLYLGAGGAVEYCVGATVGSVRANERDFHFSTNVVVGTEYRANDWLGFYFEPELGRYLTKTRLKSIRNDSPLTFTLRLGVSFTL